jgi:ribonuclease Y
MFSLNYVYIGLGFFALGAVLTFIYFHFRDKWFMSTTRQEATKLLEQAKSESDRLEKESKFQLKEQMLQTKMEMEREAREKTKDIQAWEKRLLTKEESLDKRMALVDGKEEKNKKTEDELLQRENKVKDEMQTYKNKVQEAQKKLEVLTGMTTEEAKRLQIELIVSDAKLEAARYIKQIEEDTKDEADKKAKYVISTAIQRYAGEYVAERTISTVNLPSDELKGRIIGREGRNIRAIEAATGVDLIIDDTPETVVISSFDPLRREAARLSIERLIADGRIHPGRIEEIVEKVKKELDKEVKETGEQAMFEVGVHGIDRKSVG